MLKKGDIAPDFSLKGNDDKEHRLSDQKGHKVVLIFYPFDFSSFCEKQHACMRDDLAAFRNADARVFGISVDHIHAHKAFAKSLGLEYPLLVDFHPKGAVASQYGVYLADKGFNGRVTFLIDADGVITDVMNYEIPSVPETAPLLSALGAR